MPDLPSAWVNVLISAVVSLVVTLAIEYAAKPRLEVRKERILDRARLRRSVGDAINLGHSNLGMYADFGGTTHNATRAEYRSFATQHRERLKAEIGEQGLEIVRTGRLLSREDPLLFEVLSILAGHFSVVAMTGTESVNTDEIDEAAGISLGLLEDPRKKNTGLRHEAREWVDHLLRRGRA